MSFEMEIPHYYGDGVRWLLIVAAVIILVGLPAYPDLLPLSPSFQVAWAVVLVLFAALTSPRLWWVIAGDALLAGFGVVLFEVISIQAYQGSEWTLFLMREGLALLFLFALYLGVKTARSMSMHQVNKL